MKRLIGFLIIAALILVPGMAAAQAPAQSPPPVAPQAAPQASPAPEHPKPGPGLACPMAQGQMTPEQMKQMHEKMGQGCPMHQQVQKQLDELRQRVDVLEKQVKKKKK